MTSGHLADLGTAIFKSGPIVAVLTLSLADWATLAAIVWTVLQVAYLVWKWRREIQSAKNPSRLGSN